MQSSKTTRRAALASLSAVAALAQRGGGPPRDIFGPDDVTLPNGKSQRDEIVKLDHRRNQEDSAALALLAVEVRQELAEQESHVVSVKMLKKLDEIEKLTRAIRSRLKRF
jgi:hypothetical protein